MTAEERIRVMELKEAGATSIAISRELGIPRSTIDSFIRRGCKADVPRCPQCGAKLRHTPHKKKKKFCSDKCRMLWWASHTELINKQAYYSCTCQNCGKEFKSYGNDHRKFCSRRCFAEYRRSGGVSGCAEK